MAYFLLFTSVLIETLKNLYLNHFGKDYTKTKRDAYLFNAVCSIGGLLFLICTGYDIKLSVFSIVLAFCFALATTMAQFFLLMSMATGSLSYSVLISYLSLIIPTVASMIWNWNVTFLQIIGLILMIITLYLGVGAKKDSKITGKWLLYSAGSFVAWGMVGLIQIIHQSSPYKGEINGFLIWGFVMVTVFFFLFYTLANRKSTETANYKIKSKSTVLVLLSGVVVGATNKINLYLSGVLPGIIFFPIVYGGVIILSGIVSVCILKEELSKTQMLGIVLGILSVCLLAL